jgi:sugar O-acyltransferase (sialic acid O-acetyltransferase NeuD family)
MNAKEMILIGAGGHAKSCIEVIESIGEYSITQVVGQEVDLGSRILDHVVRHTDADLAALRKKYEFAFIGVGQIHNPEPRVRLFLRLTELGFKLPAIVSKNATVSKFAIIGNGSIVMNGAILNADCVIGENVILNSSSLIEHDVTVGDHCHIATRVTVNGGTKIGQATFLGSGTIVRNGIEIGDNSFVGMGSIVSKSLPANSIFKADL